MINSIWNIIVMSGVSAGAATAALAILLKLQPGLEQSLATATSPLAQTLGPIVGLCLAAPLVAEEIVYRFLWLTGEYCSRIFRYIDVAVTTLALLAAIFARATLAAIVVSTVLSINPTGLCRPQLSFCLPLC